MIISLKKDREVSHVIVLRKLKKNQNNIIKNTNLNGKDLILNLTEVVVVNQEVILQVIRGKNIKRRRKNTKNQGERVTVPLLLGQ